MIRSTRDAGHVDQALAASEIDLDQPTMQRIHEMRDATPVVGPIPETV